MEARLLNGDNIEQLGLYIYLDGFRKVITQAFTISKNLDFELDRHKYQAGPRRDVIWYERMYHQQWTQEEVL